ncbi:hypothetical protein QT970_29825, partial [Microcoleus sp. herbarium8]|uniref:hypothetical protein n=1 Tax=Microcoleus sp. herbarium8 TaxID=3055436 RepID=UPI002FD0CD66
PIWKREEGRRKTGERRREREREEGRREREDGSRKTEAGRFFQSPPLPLSQSPPLPLAPGLLDLGRDRVKEVIFYVATSRRTKL